MSNRWVRRAFLGLIFAFPVLMVAASSRSLGRFATAARASSPLVMVEAMMVGGVVFAGRERRRLVLAIDAAAMRRAPEAVRPSAILTGPRKLATPAASWALKH